MVHVITELAVSMSGFTCESQPHLSLEIIVLPRCIEDKQKQKRQKDNNIFPVDLSCISVCSAESFVSVYLLSPVSSNFNILYTWIGCIHMLVFLSIFRGSAEHADQLGQVGSHITIV